MSRKNLSRREFLRLSAVAFGGVALASCGAPGTQTPQAQTSSDEPAASNQPPPTEAGTISYWVFWNQYADTIKFWEDKLKERIAPNNIDIRTGVQAEEVFLTSVAAGTPPDIGTGHHYIDYMSKDQVVPIEEFVATSSNIKKENFSPAAWDSTFYNGKQYGVSAIEAFVRRGLNYNTRLVEEAGLDPDKPPVTWTDTMHWHEQLTKFDDAGNLKQIGLDPFDAEGGLFATSDGSFAGDSWGFEYFDPSTRTFNINHEKMAESFDVMGEFVKIIGPDNLSGMRSVEGQGTWGGSFNAGVQAMIIEGYWHPGETAHENPEVSAVNRATWIPVPENRRGTKVQFGGGHMVFIYKGAKNPPQAVFPVAEFLNTTEHCEPVFNTIGWLPDYQPFFKTIDPNKFPGLEFYVRSAEEATEWHHNVWCEISGFVERKYTELAEQVYRGQMTGAQAAEELQRAAEQEWREAGYADA
jgi:ABC-type glycerol-3-phosphate transport system substrate-binding protein